ncbi:MAG: amylo-alpha-1,6-glucosidase [Myxococcota bacterium]
MDEWLETDGLGGFAMGTRSGTRTRRYHGLLVAATTPPTGRSVLVSDVEIWIDTPRGSWSLSTHYYAPGVRYPDGAEHIQSFEHAPFPRWVYKLPDGTEIEKTIFMPHGRAAAALSLRLRNPGRVRVRARPLLALRDYHHLRRHDAQLNLDPSFKDGVIHLHPGNDDTTLMIATNGDYKTKPEWYLRFLYEDEQTRGLDHEEDLASPGEISYELGVEPLAILFGAQNPNLPAAPVEAPALKTYLRWFDAERTRRQAFPTPLHRAADQYIVRGMRGTTIIAGYPWFTDWGRDTFVALRGLCFATGRTEDAQEILSTWANSFSDGLLPNRYADADQPEYNSMDSALWFALAVGEHLSGAGSRNSMIPGGDAFEDILLGIVEAYRTGTAHGIGVDKDGLLMGGARGMALTWMDARIGDWVITPRAGKPVEIQALWIQALRQAAALRPRKYDALLSTALRSFEERFWNPSKSCLYDVVDVDGRPGSHDEAIRPNQIFALGGAGDSLLDPERTRAALEVVERDLLTPVGLRTLARTEPGYQPYYRGGVRDRDAAYHQGTVWPWLMGGYVEAWVKARGATAEAKAEAKARFIPPLLAELNRAGLGHLSEIHDGDAPHDAGGCPFQAWSVGELLRLTELVLGDGAAVKLKPRSPRERRPSSIRN